MLKDIEVTGNKIPAAALATASWKQPVKTKRS